jgi:hypothetical protein
MEVGVAEVVDGFGKWRKRMWWACDWWYGDRGSDDCLYENLTFYLFVRSTSTRSQYNRHFLLHEKISDYLRGYDLLSGSRVMQPLGKSHNTGLCALVDLEY